MSDAICRPWEQAPRINHWVYESIPGQINGCDGDGRVLVAIVADSMFAARLAAAFNAAGVCRPPEVARPARPAFPWA